MSQFPRHDERTAPPEARPLLAAGRERFGFLPNLLANMAESPALLEAYQSLAEIFARSGLNELQQTIVLLTVSRYHQCRYCVAAHSVAADLAKVPHEVTNAIRGDRPIDEPVLEVLRRFTEHLLERRGWADDEQVEAMRAAGYSHRQILDVVVGVGLKTLSNYTNHLAGTRLDEPLAKRDWCPRCAKDERAA